MPNKVVLITGCSTGIGRALAEEFHRRNYIVVATALDLASIDDLKAKGIGTYTMDVNNKDQIEKVLATVLNKEKTIDVLINNAGYALIGPSIEIPADELLLQFQTNVFSPLFLIQKVAPVMKAAGTGLIINIGSVSGIATTPFSGAYCASKAALHAISDALRMELSVFGINLVTVQPGGIKTQLGESAKKKISRILQPDSWYHTVVDSIRSRAVASQIDATPADEFATKLVNAVLVKNPPIFVRIGKNSSLIPFLKRMAPPRLLDEIFKRKFGLTKLKHAF